MKKNPKKVLWFVIACLFSVVNCDYFTVVGPKALRIDEPYKLAVTSHDSYGSSENIKVEIEGAGFNGKEFKVIKDVATVPGETTTTEIFVRRDNFILNAFYQILLQIDSRLVCWII